MNKCDICQQDKAEAVAIVIHFPGSSEYRYLTCRDCANDILFRIDYMSKKVIH